jgi:hypothetical protein
VAVSPFQTKHSRRLPIQFTGLLPRNAPTGISSPRSVFWGHNLWNSVWGEFISIPQGVIGMATTCEDKSGAEPTASFAVECRDWIEAHGSQRRDITGGERNSRKYEGDASEGEEIGRRHAVEQPGHEVRDDERSGHT